MNLSKKRNYYQILFLSKLKLFINHLSIIVISILLIVAIVSINSIVGLKEDVRNLFIY